MSWSLYYYDWYWYEWVMMGVCIVLVLLPPKYDPAIRLKMWTEKKK